MVHSQMYGHSQQQHQQQQHLPAAKDVSGTFHGNPGGGCRSLMITNLDPRVDDMLLTQVLSVAGQVTQVRLVPDRLNPGHPLAYVDFVDHASAETAMTTLAGQKIYDFPISIQWNFQQAPKKEDTSTHYHIWVGDLAADVDDPMLIRMFSVFPSMSDARIMWDQQTGKSRGYGFVSFRDKADADRAMTTMQGQYLGSKPVRINWAHQKNAMAGHGTGVGPAGGFQQQQQQQSYSASSTPTDGQVVLPKQRALDYHTVAGQSSPMHTTVYIGNLPPHVSTELLMPYFQSYGYVSDITLHLDRGFAFVKMDTHENAANAISYLHGHYIGGRPVRCSWGKDRMADQAAGAGYGGGHHRPYSGHSQPQGHYGGAGAGAGGYGAYPGYPAGYGYGQPGATAANPYAAYGYGQYPQGYDYSQYVQYYQQQAQAYAAQQQHHQQQQQQQSQPQSTSQTPQPPSSGDQQEE